MVFTSSDGLIDQKAFRLNVFASSFLAIEWEEIHLKSFGNVDEECAAEISRMCFLPVVESGTLLEYHFYNSSWFVDHL